MTTTNTQKNHVNANLPTSIYDGFVGPLVDVGLALFDYEESIDADAVRLHFEDDRDDCAVYLPYKGKGEVVYFSEGARRRFKSAVNKALWAFNEGTRTAAPRIQPKTDDWPIDQVFALTEHLFEEMETELKLEPDGCDGGWDSAYAALSDEDANLKVRWSMDVDVKRKTRLCSITWEIHTSDPRLLALAGAHRDRINATIELYNTRIRNTYGRKAQG